MANSNAEIIEYLFIDEVRLNLYFEQLSSPMAYDKVPIWNAVLGLTGPKAEATQTRPGRAFTMHEKITKFQSYINDNNLVLDYRPRDAFEPRHLDTSKPFRSERMEARKCHIPLQDGQSTTGALNIWISIQPDDVQPADMRRRTGTLFLIEDFRGKERHVKCLSGYSSLMLLTEELRPVIDQTQIEAFRRQDAAREQFGKNPVDTLADLGAKFGPPRRINAIYRVRATCNETAAEAAVTTIGYPIIVKEQ